MTVHLPNPVEHSVNEAVRNGRFLTVDDALPAAWIAFNVPMQKPWAVASAPLSILEMVDDLRKDVPLEEFAKLPTDGAKQLDHYLYGSPKRTDA